MSIQAPDLFQRPPRSPRCRLGGYVILPRMLDKGRATLVGKNGEYHYNCPLDEHFTTYTGIDAGQLKEQLATGKGDGEILEWILAHRKHQHGQHEINAWSDYQDYRGTTDVEGREYFHDYHVKLAPKREDVSSWFDVLDIDDFVSFGGKA